MSICLDKESRNERNIFDSAKLNSLQVTPLLARILLRVMRTPSSYEPCFVHPQQMPKKCTRKRKKSKGGKSSDFVSEVEQSRLSDPNNPSKMIESIFDMPENNRMKTETLSYPDVRFQHSTTLFPAEGVEEKYVPSEIPNVTSKRGAEDDLNFTTSKKTPNQHTRFPTDIHLKVESNENTSEVSANCVAHIKVESSENTNEITADDDLAGSSYPAIQTVTDTAIENNSEGFSDNNLHIKTEPSILKETHTGVSSEKSNNADNGLTDTSYPVFQAAADKASEITSDNNLQIKTEHEYPVFQAVADKSSDNNSEVTSDNNIHIKTEPSISNENNTGVSSEKSHNADDDLAGTSYPVSQAVTDKSSDNNSEVSSDNNIHIKTEPSISNENNTGLSSEKSHNADDDLAGTSYPVFQAVADKSSDNNSEVTSDNNIHIKTEPSISNENNTGVSSEKSHNADEVTSDNNIQIKTEPSISNENNTGLSSEKSHNADEGLAGTSYPVFQAVADKSRDNNSEVTSDNNIQIKTEPSTSNENYTGVSTEKCHIADNKDRDTVNNKLSPSNTTSIYMAKYTKDAPTSFNHLMNDVSIKVEQNENSVNNSTSISNISFDANQTNNSSVDRPVKSKNYALDNSEAQENVVCDKNKNDIDPSVNYLLNSAQVESEPEKENKNSCNNEKSQSCENTRVIPSEILNACDLSQASSSNTNDDIFSGDKQRTFPTPFLKYLNCNKKINILKLSHARSVLNNLIKNKGSINVIETDVITDSSNSQNNSGLCLTEKRKDLPDLQINEKQSLNAAVDESLQNNSSGSNFKKLGNSKLNITNLDSISASTQLGKSSNESQVQNSLYSDKIYQNNLPNIRFESSSNKNDSNSPANNVDMPMTIQSPLDDNCLSTIRVSSLDENKQSETSSNLPLKAKKIPNELSTDFLRQILDNVKSTNSESIANQNSSLNSSIVPVAKSNIIIEENVNEKNSGRTIQNSENISESLAVPHENVFKQTQKLRFNPPTTYAEAFETPPKKIKISEEASTSNSDKDKKISYEKYKKNETHIIGSPHYPPDQNLRKVLDSGLPSNTFDSSPGSFNFEKNKYTPPSNCQNNNLIICSEASLQKPGSPRMDNTNYPRDPRLARNYSPTLDRDVSSQKQLDSSNIFQVYPSPSVSEAKKSSIHSQMKQTPSVSTSYAMRNSSTVPTPAEPFNSIVNAKIQQVKPMLSKINGSNPTDFNIGTFNKNNNVIVPPIAPGSTSSSTAQLYNPYSTIQYGEGYQSFSHLPGNTSSPSVHYQHLVSQQIRPPMSWNCDLTQGHYSSINHKFIFNPSLQVRYPPPHLSPSLAPILLIGKQSDSVNKKHKLQ
ncbi:hypothetical protein HNY73_009547 [Argiope bruennichi]|uniref:Uncharacterized protein n=1 Tax=Argiope bruennichi TaxID=94029 RepID=A0A8T0F9U5_ARGBR|nr:hypothetical protein HNY73_009547 [Argiope bruennichi]